MGPFRLDGRTALGTGGGQGSAHWYRDAGAPIAPLLPLRKL